MAGSYEQALLSDSQHICFALLTDLHMWMKEETPKDFQDNWKKAEPYNGDSLKEDDLGCKGVGRGICFHPYRQPECEEFKKIRYIFVTQERAQSIGVQGLRNGDLTDSGRSPGSTFSWKG